MRFVASYWPGSGLGAVAIGAAVLVALLVVARRHPDPGRRRLAAASIAVTGIASALVLQYAAVGVDDLALRYVAYFSVMVPAFALAMAAVGLADLPGPALAARLDRRGATAYLVAPAGAVVAVVLLSSAAFENPIRGDPRMPSIFASVADDPRRAGREVALEFGVDAWPVSVGLLHYARHHGIDACAANAWVEFIVTADLVCDPPDPAERWVLDVTPATTAPPDAASVYADAGTVIAPAP
jgi:hypothetical protein